MTAASPAAALEPHSVPPPQRHAVCCSCTALGIETSPRVPHRTIVCVASFSKTSYLLAVIQGDKMTREQRSVQYNVALGPNHRDQIFFTADTLTGGIVVCVCLLPVVAYLYIETGPASGLRRAACGAQTETVQGSPCLPCPVPYPPRGAAALCSGALLRRASACCLGNAPTSMPPSRPPLWPSRMDTTPHRFPSVKALSVFLDA